MKRVTRCMCNMTTVLHAMSPLYLLSRLQSAHSELAEILFHLTVHLSLYVCTACTANRSIKPLGVLNANSSKTVKAMDFKFDTHLSQVQFGYDPLNIFKRWRGQGDTAFSLKNF